MPGDDLLESPRNRLLDLFFAKLSEERTPDTVWQLLSQLSDFIGIKNRHCEL